MQEARSGRGRRAEKIGVITGWSAALLAAAAPKREAMVKRPSAGFYFAWGCFSKK
jgi:hypothetical protein